MLLSFRKDNYNCVDYMLYHNHFDLVNYFLNKKYLSQQDIWTSVTSPMPNKTYNFLELLLLDKELKQFKYIMDYLKPTQSQKQSLWELVTTEKNEKKGILLELATNYNTKNQPVRKKQKKETNNIVADFGFGQYEREINTDVQDFAKAVDQGINSKTIKTLLEAFKPTATQIQTFLSQNQITANNPYYKIFQEYLNQGEKHGSAKK